MQNLRYNLVCQVTEISNGKTKISELPWGTYMPITAKLFGNLEKTDLTQLKQALGACSHSLKKTKKTEISPGQCARSFYQATNHYST